MSDSTPTGSLLELTCAQLAHYPEAQLVFKGFCIPYDASDISRLRDKIVDTAEWVCGFTSEKMGPDLALASDLCGRAVMLLERYHQFSEEQQALVVGAVRYLTFRVDAVPDRHGSRGLEDDREVMNAVLERLGLSSWRVNDSTQVVILSESLGDISTRGISDELRRRKHRWQAFRLTRKSPHRPSDS